MVLFNVDVAFKLAAFLPSWRCSHLDCVETWIKGLASSGCWSSILPGMRRFPHGASIEVRVSGCFWLWTPMGCFTRSCSMRIEMRWPIPGQYLINCGRICILYQVTKWVDSKLLEILFVSWQLKLLILHIPAFVGLQMCSSFLKLLRDLRTSCRPRVIENQYSRFRFACQYNTGNMLRLKIIIVIPVCIPSLGHKNDCPSQYAFSETVFEQIHEQWLWKLIFV